MNLTPTTGKGIVIAIVAVLIIAAAVFATGLWVWLGITLALVVVGWLVYTAGRGFHMRVMDWFAGRRS